ncbi:unnamed protein product [Cochlearia groenlandica]
MTSSHRAALSYMWPEFLMMDGDRDAPPVFVNTDDDVDVFVTLRADIDQLSLCASTTEISLCIDERSNNVLLFKLSEDGGGQTINVNDTSHNGAMVVYGGQIHTHRSGNDNESKYLAETKVRVSLECDKPLVFSLELEFEDEVISVSLSYDKLKGVCGLCNMMTHAANCCPLRVAKPGQEREGNRRPDWDRNDRREGNQDRRNRRYEEDINKNQPRGYRGASYNVGGENRVETQNRPPLQRQLLPEFRSALEEKVSKEKRDSGIRVSTKDWVVTAFGKAGKDGVVIDEEKFKQAGRRDGAETEKKEAVAGIYKWSEKTHGKLSGEPAEGRRPIGGLATEPIGSSITAVAAPAITKAMTTAAPTVAKDKGVKQKSIIVEAINNLQITKARGIRRDTQMHHLSIADIISPLKDLYEIPTEEENMKSTGKKKKEFEGALSAKKKIVNKLARNGKMIKTARLTMNDYALVANTRPVKMGPDKDKKEGSQSAGGRSPTGEKVR